MSPTPPIQTSITETSSNKWRGGPLKTNKESHLIKKTTSSSWNKAQQQRQPVIIYTHSPRVIQTNPRDFMELVQKLTGLSRSSSQQQQEKETEKVVVCKEENETTSSSLITTEENNNCNVGGDQVKSSCLVGAPLSTLMEPPMIPYVFGHSSAEFLCSNTNKGLLTYADPFLF